MMRNRGEWLMAMILAVSLVMTGCGGDDRSEVDAAPTADTPSPDTPSADTPSPVGGSSDAPSADTPSPDGGSTTAPSGTEPSPTTPFPIDRTPPDFSEMTPTDEPPDHNWMFLTAYAQVTAGGKTAGFIGDDPIWTTEFNIGGRAYPLATVGNCSIIQTADGLVVAQASFHATRNREMHSSFSMSDNGDGTVTWGFYDEESGEEWSATGPGSASVSYAHFTAQLGAPWEDPEADNPDTEQLYVLIEFEGPASENFSTEKGRASSRVLCHYIPRLN